MEILGVPVETSNRMSGLALWIHHSLSGIFLVIFMLVGILDSDWYSPDHILYWRYSQCIFEPDTSFWYSLNPYLCSLSSIMSS